jgi:hypothetical protein
MACSRFVRSWEMAGDGSAAGSGVWMGVRASKSGRGSDRVWTGAKVGGAQVMVVGKKGALGYMCEGRGAGYMQGERLAFLRQWELEGELCW